MWNVRNWPVWYRGAPSSLTNSGRSEALVWRPWINKPSGMTMHCAHICHHAALDPAPSSSSPLSCPPSHLHPSSLLSFSFNLPSVSSPLPLFSCLPSGSIHPLVHPCMHGWLSVWGFCLCCTQGYGTALPLRRHTAAEMPEFRPANSIYLSKRNACRFSVHNVQVQSNSYLEFRNLK